MPKIILENKEIEVSRETYDGIVKIATDNAVGMSSVPNKPKRWVPAVGEDYWYSGSDGCLYCSSRSGGETNKVFDFRVSIGNCFKTQDEAIEALKTGWIAKRQAQVRIENYIIDNGLEFDPDWENHIQRKYGIYFQHDSGKFGWDCWYQTQNGCFWYFKSQEDIIQVINNCENDLKMLWGVK